MKLLQGCLGVVLLALPSGAMAAPVLLGEFSYGMGGSSSNLPVASITAISFELGDSTRLSGGICEVPRIGCEGIPLAQIVPGATFEFTSASPHFARVVGLLTNGIDDRLAHVHRMLGATGPTGGAGGGSGRESSSLHRSPDFVGFAISAIRLRIDAFEIGDNTLCGGQPGGYCYNSRVTWQFFQDDGPTPALPITWGGLKAGYR